MHVLSALTDQNTATTFLNRKNIFSIVILLEVIMKFITISLTVSITPCVFYAHCSIIFILKHKEKLTILK